MCNICHTIFIFEIDLTIMKANMLANKGDAASRHSMSYHIIRHTEKDISKILPLSVSQLIKSHKAF